LYRSATGNFYVTQFDQLPKITEIRILFLKLLSCTNKC
jgi:hypothetical protein